MFNKKSLWPALLLTIAALACKPAFNATLYKDNPDKLWQVANAEYKAGRFDNAAKAFEQLTLQLTARDPRLPVSYYYLAQSQTKNGEYLLAAGTYNRLIDAFPQDTLVDDAFFLSGKAYEHEWRGPQLDATYGKSAVTAFESLLTAYPDSPFAARARNELAKLDEWFAEKDYDTGYLYLKRKAFDSAIIYFKDVIRLHPNARKTREAYLRLLEAYRAIKYTEDARDLCDAMRKAYPNDRKVSGECGPAAATPAT
jgi:outer membrane protein assembly factor BamD